ncbi:MAG: hypothetical protein PVG39_10600, partial [Desulfobacteraceae bacterium]
MATCNRTGKDHSMVQSRTIEHPELAVSLSKLGVDLVIMSEKNMTEEEFLLARVKDSLWFLDMSL